MSNPKRREQRRTHLDASVMPVERALLARAEALETASWSVSAGCVAVAGSGGAGKSIGGGIGGLGGQGGSVYVVGGNAVPAGGGAGGASSAPSPLGVALAAEFRALAEELHWW